MRIRTTSLGLMCAALATLAAPRDVDACGGCYHREAETETTVVTGHRMVVSVSQSQTVLWDQIQYAGEPSEFAWVLPVKPGARVELATDAWFETLDSATAARVLGPRLDCAPPPSSDSGFGCGASEDAQGAVGDLGPGDGEPVTIVHEGTVGPYETVTLSTEEAGALNTWLTDHGYAVDDGVQPVIDAYVAEGFDFIALRLQPGAGIRQMKPVRVVSPGASPTFPLRMVAAGTGARVELTLFVIGEGRWEASNFPNAIVPLDGLSWDHLTTSSNYASLRQDALAANEGRTWITTFAKAGALLQPGQSGASFGTYDGVNMPPASIAEAFIGQARANGETGGACAPAFADHVTDASLVVDTCSADAGGRPVCGEPEVGQLDSRIFECGTADDLAVALIGMHPRDVWLARLEAELPRSALASDLDLAAASDQSAVDNWLTPREELNGQDVCRANGAPAATIAKAPPPRGGGNAIVAASLLAFALLLAQRRKSRART